MGHPQLRTAVLARDLGVVPARFVAGGQKWRRLVQQTGYIQGGICIGESYGKLDSRIVAVRCHR